jgi:hypothetical protein
MSHNKYPIRFVGNAATTFIRTGDMGALLCRQLFITGAQRTTHTYS